MPPAGKPASPVRWVMFTCARCFRTRNPVQERAVKAEPGAPRWIYLIKYIYPGDLHDRPVVPGLSREYFR